MWCHFGRRPQRRLQEPPKPKNQMPAKANPANAVAAMANLLVGGMPSDAFAVDVLTIPPFRKWRMSPAGASATRNVPPR
jgi:hypothetical protein